MRRGRRWCSGRSRCWPGSPRLESFRSLFGDERTDYGQALQRHYERGPSEEWKGSFVSAYAASHPWEDWAETWAHYLRMVDTLETAHAYGVSHAPAPAPDASPRAFDTVVTQWLGLTVILNALSRSMGHEDLYPFELGDQVQRKLAFVHEVVAANSTNTS
jgi:hypothetical protein